MDHTFLQKGLVWNVGKPANIFDCGHRKVWSKVLRIHREHFGKFFFSFSGIFRSHSVQPNRQLCSVNICTKRNAWQIKCEIVLSAPNLESTSIFHHLENYMEEKPYSCLAVKWTSTFFGMVPSCSDINWPTVKTSSFCHIKCPFNSFSSITHKSSRVIRMRRSRPVCTRFTEKGQIFGILKSPRSWGKILYFFLN